MFDFVPETAKEMGLASSADANGPAPCTGAGPFGALGRTLSHMTVDVALFAYLSDYQPDGAGRSQPAPVRPRARDHGSADVIATLGLPDEPRVVFVNGRHAPEDTVLVRRRPSRDLPAGRGGLSAVADGPACFEPLEPTDDPALRARLAASHVAVIGCGGLGSNAAAMLVRSGVGELTHHRLRRRRGVQPQPPDVLPRPAGPAQDRRPCRDTLVRIYPDVVLHVHTECVTAENLAALVEGADVIIEAVDRAEVKAMIANAAARGACRTRRS